MAGFSATYGVLHTCIRVYLFTCMHVYIVPSCVLIVLVLQLVLSCWSTPMPVSENRRTDSVRIRLSDDMMARLERVSAGYGMPVSTVAAFAVSDFVQQKENSLSMGREALNKMTEQAIQSLELTPADMEAMASAFEPMIQAMINSRTAIGVQPIDHEEAQKAS